MSCPVCCIEESPEMSDEEYAEFLEETHIDTHFTYPDLKDYELDRDYEDNMPLENSGTGKVYGWEDDIPF